MQGFNVIVIYDTQASNYTAYLAELPGIIVQSQTKDAIPDHLDRALNNYMKYLDKKRQNDFSFSEQIFPG